MKKNFPRTVPFPSISPDLSVIENLWTTLKDRVACHAPRSEVQLISSLQNRKIIKSNKFFPFFYSLHTKHQECIEVEGESLPY